MTKFLLTIAAVASFSAVSFANTYNYTCGDMAVSVSDTQTVTAASANIGTCAGNLVAGTAGFLRATMGGDQCTAQFDLMVQRSLLTGAGNGYVMAGGNAVLCSRN